MIDGVAIVGAGFSGTLQAINLLRHDGPRPILIERAREFGKGVAYGAAHSTHLLNVRAGNMSALPDDPGSFAGWLRSRGLPDAEGAFVPRVTYGEYLVELLEEVRRGSGDRLELLHGDVVDARPAGDQVELRFADGRSRSFGSAVLAVGNLPPHDPPGLDAAHLPGERYARDPWAPGLARGLADDDTVLVIGTGLTMVDTVLMLEACGFGGRIVAISRRGLLPRRHVPPGAPWSPLRERPNALPSHLVQAVRQRAAQVGWRNAVDELRPFTQAMWANAGEDERARFLRHLRPWWDVHRHRLAPAVADRIASLQDSGRLAIHAGKTLAFDDNGDTVAVTWRPRGHDAPATLRVRRIINCTGPQGDLLRTEEPLLRALVDRGVIRPDAARIGIDVDAQARTLAADGTPNERLFALGPMTRGAFWEIVAVPDIRTQAWNVARRLSNAHWVEGEGL